MFPLAHEQRISRLPYLKKTTPGTINLMYNSVLPTLPTVSLQSRHFHLLSYQQNPTNFVVLSEAVQLILALILL